MELNLNDMDIGFDELGNFTLDELGEMTLDELSMPLPKLLDSLASRNASIPVHVYEKLTKLYNDIEHECSQADDKQTKQLSFPKLDTLANQADNLKKIISFLYTIYAIVTNEHIQQMICDFFDILISFFNN